MNLDPKMMLWSVINFLILLVLLRRFLWKPILGILESRERAVASSLEGAENAREEAVRMKEDYERRLGEAQKRAEDLVARAARKAEDMGNELRAKAEAEAAAILDRAQQEIQREKEQALAELRDQVADLAVMVAGKVLERSVKDEDNERLARRLVAGLGEAS